MEITQEKIDLISKLIKCNRKFSGNEDLYDDFLNETCQRSASIIDTIANSAVLETYLNKVVTTSIISVLKDSGRLRRTRAGYMSTSEVPIETVMPVSSVQEDNLENLMPTIDYDSLSIGYSGVRIAFSPESNMLHHEVIDFVANTLEMINEKEPEERYMDLFILRYDKCMTQKEIANEMGISQSEVSKRIYGLLDRVKRVLDEQ